MIPVQTEWYALEGMSQLINSIKLVQMRINPNLKLFGIALTMYQKNNTLSNIVSEEVRKSAFKKQVFSTMVPRNSNIAQAPMEGAPVVLLKKWNRYNKGSQAYWSLAKEVSDRVKKMRHKYGIYEKNQLKIHKLNQSNDDAALTEQLE